MSFFGFEGPVELIGHRGYSARAPENTMAAIELAIDSGADAIEFDVHVTSDGTPVLLHDATLDRTTDGSGRVAEAETDAVAGLDAGSWFDASFAGEPVPTLATAMTALGGRVGRVYAELKGYRTLDDVATVVDLIRRAGAVERTVLISMKWHALAAARDEAPELPIGYIVESRKRTDEALTRADGDRRALVDLDARVLLADPGIASRARELNVALATWTVDSVAEADRLLAMDVPRITTNEVGTLRAWKDSL